jgi:hypothetical protein
MAFDSAGNLFQASLDGSIYKFTPGGAQSTFASGLNAPEGLAFNSTGDLFVADEGIGQIGSGDIYEFTSGGSQSTFASGLNPDALAFQPVPEPSSLGVLAIGTTAFVVRHRKLK